MVQLICAGMDGAGVIETELLICPDCTFKAVASIRLLALIISEELPDRLRCLLLEGAFVGVIVTDGVMVRFEPARDSPIGRR